MKWGLLENNQVVQYAPWEIKRTDLDSPPIQKTLERLKRTGMEIPIAKDIIDLHKGKIWVESKAGEGTKFIFTLPRDARAQKLKK